MCGGYGHLRDLCVVHADRETHRGLSSVKQSMHNSRYSTIVINFILNVALMKTVHLATRYEIGRI